MAAPVEVAAEVLAAEAVVAGVVLVELDVPLVVVEFPEIDAHSVC